MPEPQIIDGIKVSIKRTTPADVAERKKRLQALLSKVAMRQKREAKD